MEPNRLLALAAASGRIGVVFFIGPRLMDWRISNFAARSPRAAAAYTEKLIVSLQPQSLADMDLMRTIKPIELLVPVSFTPRGASTSGLSTWWSSTALKGMLVLKEASCLDAFSSYPVRI